MGGMNGGVEVSYDKLALGEDYIVNVSDFESGLSEVMLDGKIVHSYAGDGSYKGQCFLETIDLSAGDHTVTAKNSDGKTAALKFTIYIP